MPTYEGVSCATCGWRADTRLCHCSESYSGGREPLDDGWCDRWQSQEWVATEMSIRRLAGERRGRLERGEIVTGEL